jgi:NADH:ubiquinone oxidoreductase subunit 4 (subunit M)
VIPLAIITVILGVYPAPFLNLVKSTLNLIIEMVASGSPIAGM